MDNKDLIRQYVDTRLGIPEYQFNQLSNNDKRTYLRKMAIVIENDLTKLDYYYGELPEKTQINIVNQNGGYLVYLKNPSEAVKLAAVNKDSYVIRGIVNPSEEVQLSAIKQTPDVFKYIKNPTKMVIKLYKQLTNGQ